MLGLKNAQTLIGLLTLFLAYFCTIAPAGSFRAWVAKKMGDDTADELGFLTLNPLVHIDFFGLVWLLAFSRPQYLSGFGWGKHIPINPDNIQGSWRRLKLACAFFSDSLMHFCMATAAFTTASLMFIGHTKTGAPLCSTSFEQIIVQLLFAFVSLNVFLVLVQFAINAVILIALYVSDNSVTMNAYLHYFILLAPLVILLLFGQELHYLLLHGISSVERYITACFVSSAG